MNRLAATRIEPQGAAVVRIRPAAVLARLAAGVRPDSAEDAYAMACAEHQLWSDLCLVAQGSDQPLSLQRHVRVRAVRAAHRALKAALAAPAVMTPKCTYAPDRKIEIVLRGDTQDTAVWLDILERALMVPMPESYGYDLADAAICLDDARQFARSRAIDHSLIVVGIRGGGSYLAPYWVAGLALEAGTLPFWTTVRPLGGSGQRGGFHHSELERLHRQGQLQSLPNSLCGRAGIVIVDDQPDSGRTVDQLADALAPSACELWFASIGKVSRLSGAGPRSVLTRTSLRPRQRAPLWQLLMKEDHSQLIETLAEALPSARLSGAATVVIRCPTLERRYGRPHAWLPWNHPQLRQGGRQLINPKKTPLTVLDDDGNPLLHLRFVGEGPFGLAEFRRVQSLDVEAGEAWFVDGYRVATHIPGLRSLRDALAQASPVEAAEMFARCAETLRSSRGRRLVDVDGQLPGAIRVGERICALLDRLSARTGVGLDLPSTLAWLRQVVVPAYGGSRQPVVSSLRYAWSHWHWQATPDGAIRRFHLEANWGGPSWPELEVAAFLLEHRLGPASLNAIPVRAGPPSILSAPSGGSERGGRFISDSEAVWDAQQPVLAASLPLAALLIVEGCCRELSQVSREGGASLRDDLSGLWRVVASYADFITTNCRGEHA